METYGAHFYASPTGRNEYEKSIIQDDQENPGSLGIAISEAVEVAAKSGRAK